MHVRTNIEHNIIQVIIIAICPLVAVLSSLSDALLLGILTFVCFIVSSLVCQVFNKYTSRNIKIFITAILSSFIVTIFNYFISKNEVSIFVSKDTNFFAVLSTICLCVDVYFIQTKAVKNNYFLTVIGNSVLFVGILLIYALFIEFLGDGTVFGGKVISSYAGIAFYKSITFKLILLGLIGVVADAVYRIYFKHIEKRRMTYGKFVRKIRDEKKFQYDDLRRRRLLVSPVEINRISSESAKKLEEKADVNADSGEVDNKKQEESESEEIEIKEEPKPKDEETEEEKPKKAKKRKKQGKVEKVYPSKKDTEEGGENK